MLVNKKTAFNFAIFLILMLSSCGRSNDPLVFNITFKDSDNLNIGQFVVYKGIRIGEVTNILLNDDGQVYVSVKISPEYKEKTYREAEFSIEKPNGFMDMSGERQISMEDHSGNRTPLLEGDTINGYNGILDKLVSKTTDFGKVAFNWAENTSNYVIQSLGELAETPEAKNLIEELKNFGEKAGSLSEGEYNNLKNEKYPKLIEDGKKLKEQMEKDGQIEKAQNFWNKFSSSMEKLKQ